MYCQKCRTPIKFDSTLEDLNPAAFDLLVGATIKSQRNTTLSSRSNYPQERKDLYDRVSTQTSSPLHKRTIPAPHDEERVVEDGEESELSRAPPDMSFIEITQSQIVPAEKVNGIKGQNKARPKKTEGLENGDSPKGVALSPALRKNEKLFAILSSHSDIDHPICAECTSLLLSSYNARLVSATKERDAYATFLKSLQHNSSTSTTTEEAASVEKELQELLKQDQQAYEELQAAEDEKRALEAELADLEEESRQLEIEEAVFWATRNAYADELHELNTDLASLQQKYTHDQQRLEQLQRTNVYNDTFCIGHDGVYGTINGLRLGRLPFPSPNVEWTEINAAWGQTLLLLATVAEKLEYNFQGYRLRPMGSTSKIEKLEYPQQSPDIPQGSGSTAQQRSKIASANPPARVTSYDLFSSGETALSRLGKYKSFDAAMVAFLECLAQVCDHVERTILNSGHDRPNISRTASSKNVPARRALPYTIQGDKIGDVSIKFGAGFQSDENFTKACKYALTCCKYLLAHISNLENQKS